MGMQKKQTEDKNMQEETTLLTIQMEEKITELQMKINDLLCVEKDQLRKMKKELKIQMNEYKSETNALSKAMLSVVDEIALEKQTHIEEKKTLISTLDSLKTGKKQTLVTMNEIKMENDNLSTDIETRKERENKWEEERRKINVNNTKIKLLHEEHLHKNSMAMQTMTLKLKEEEEKHCIEKN